MLLASSSMMFTSAALSLTAILLFAYGKRTKRVLFFFSFLVLSFSYYFFFNSGDEFFLNTLDFLWFIKSAFIFLYAFFFLFNRRVFASLSILILFMFFLFFYEHEKILSYLTLGGYFFVFTLCEVERGRLKKGKEGDFYFIALFCLFDFTCVSSEVLDIFFDNEFLNVRYFFLSAFLFFYSLSRLKSVQKVLRESFGDNFVFFSGLYIFSISLFSYFLVFFNFEKHPFLQILFYFSVIFPVFVMLNIEILSRMLCAFFSRAFLGSSVDYLKINENISEVFVSKSSDPTGCAVDILMALTQSSSVCIVDAKNKSTNQVTWFGNGERLPDVQVLEILTIKGFFQDLRWIVDANKLQNSPDDYSGSKFEMGHRWKKGWVIAPVFFDSDVDCFFILKIPESVNISKDWRRRDIINFTIKQVASYLRVLSKTQISFEQEQLIGFYQTSAFVVHDLKNVSAQLDMITDNALKYRNDPEFIEDTFSTIDSMSKRLSKVLSQLRSKLDAERSAGVSIDEWWSAVVNKANVKKVSIQKKGDIFVLESFPSLIRGVGHLIDNAIEACQGVLIPIVTISFYTENEKFIIEVNDNGEGMTADFLKNKLFKPFSTTKGNKGMGLGVFEVKEVATKKGGEIFVESALGEGTCFKIVLPFVKESDTVE